MIRDLTAAIDAIKLLVGNPATPADLDLALRKVQKRLLNTRLDTRLDLKTPGGPMIHVDPDPHRLILEAYRFLSILQKRLGTQLRPFSHIEVERLVKIVKLLDFREEGGE